MDLQGEFSASTHLAFLVQIIAIAAIAGQLPQTISLYIRLQFHTDCSLMHHSTDFELAVTGNLDDTAISIF
jgi:hypothetical protein